MTSGKDGEARKLRASPFLSGEMLRIAILAIVLLTIDVAAGAIHPAVNSNSFTGRNVSIAARVTFVSSYPRLLSPEPACLEACEFTTADSLSDALVLAMLAPIYPGKRDRAQPKNQSSR